MRYPQSAAGFTLVEVLMVLLVLSTTALALSNTLTSAHHTLGNSGRWMRAIELAAAGMEQVRAGQTLRPLDADAPFQRSSQIQPWPGHSDLYRVEVTVSWDDGESQQFRLSTLMRR